LGEPGGARARLEPGVLVGGVVDDQLGDHAQAAPVRLAHEGAEVAQRAVVGVDVVVVGDVVAVVAQRRRVERQQPDRVDAQVLDVVELLGQAAKSPMPSLLAVEERLDVQLVDDASLYQSGSSAVSRGRCGSKLPSGRGRGRSQEVVEVALGAHAAAQPEDVRRRAPRVELDVVARPARGSAAPPSRSCTW
jgi:hypothetical protein